MATGTSVKPKRFEPIEIDGEYYVLDKIPSETSGIVVAETESLLQTMPLNDLVTDLSRVGSFVRVAYNCVGAAGLQYTNEQIEIQRLGYNITKLCDKSALTVAKFKKASSKILIDLQCTYGYLLDNLEEMALDTLSSLSNLAGEMEKSALELYNEFLEEGKKVAETLENTQRAKKIQDKEKEEKQRGRVELDESISLQERLIKDHHEKEMEAQARRRELEQLEDQAVSEIGALTVKGTIKSLANAFTTKIGLGKAFDSDSDDAEKRAARFKQSRVDALEAENAIREKRLEALASMSSFAAQLKECGTENDDKKIAKYAIDALHQAVGALKHLSLVMMQAALFWKQMQNHCRSLAGFEIQSNVEKAIKVYSEEQRLKVWTSNSFMRSAISFYSSWVALSNVCGLYMTQIKETQRELYGYITENPTNDESKEMLPKIAANFMDDLQRDQLALKEKNLTAQLEMLALCPAQGEFNKK